MANTFYLDYENGDDSKDGSSWANAWKTITSGATAARIAPGDTIRIAKSPDPTSIGNATWTNASKTVTLASAQTTNIDMCETAWTAGASGDMGSGIARTAVGTDGKEGSYCMKLTPDASPQANVLQAYYATGTLDLSAKQKMSFWIKNESAVVANNWWFALCSDNAGATPVDIFQAPAMPSTGRWTPQTIARAYSVAYTGGDTAAPAIDGTLTGASSGSTAKIIWYTISSGSFAGGDAAGTIWVYSRSAAFSAEQVNYTGGHIHIGGDFTQGNLGSSIKSIALYSGNTAPTASKYLYIDDFIACTTSGLNLQSLISKNSSAQGGTEAWYGIQSINDVTILLDNGTNTKGNAGMGYSTGGTSPETVETYKRETIKTALVASDSDQVQTVQDSGTLAGGNITFEGGYDTSTSACNGETVFDGLNNRGYGIYNSGKNYVTVSHISACRYAIGYFVNSVLYSTFSNFFSNNNFQYGLNINGSYNCTFSNILSLNNNTSNGIYFYEGGNNIFNSITHISNNINYGIEFNSGASYNVFYAISNLRNSGSNGIYFSKSYFNKFFTITTANNAAYTIYNLTGTNYFSNATIGETNKVSVGQEGDDNKIFSRNLNGSANNHYVFMYSTGSGSTTINSLTNDRSGGAGLKWKYIPTSKRTSIYPMRMVLAEIPVVSGTTVTVTCYCKKDHATNIAAQLVCKGGQLSGITSDVPDVKANDTDWEQLSIQLQPTEDGVVEIEGQAWYVAGNSNAYFADIAVSST